MKTEILFLRHGESAGNLYKIFAGHYDVELTERGVLQAKAAAKFLVGQGIDAIYSSDLTRAYQTALEVSRATKVEISSCSEKLREINVGIYDGVKREIITEKYDKDFDLYFTSEFGVYSFPEGETTLEAGERFLSETIRLAKMNPNKRILIAAHAGVIRSLWGIISSVDRESLGSRIPFATNASLSYAEFDGEKIIPKEYSRSDYLSEIGFIKYSV